MKKMLCLLAGICFAAAMSTTLSSCSEEDNTVEEFPNWQETNEKYFNSLFADARQRAAAGDNSWKVLRQWSLQDSVHLDADDHVIAHVITQGTGVQSPLFTDSVRVMYSGRLLPSTSYPAGYVFDKTYAGDTFEPATSAVRGFLLSSSSLRDGFSTALQYMHVGDRWEVYIPYALGYGSEDYSSTGIPGYSTLIFDITLTGYYRNGKLVEGR